MNRLILIIMLAVFGAGLAGCNGSAADLKALKANGWQLETMKVDGKDLAAPAKLPSIAFADSTMSGFASCNRFFGRYTAGEDGSMKFELGGSTMMMCPDMKFEDSFLKALPDITAFALKDGKLVLKGEKLEMVFRVQAEDEEE